MLLFSSFIIKKVKVKRDCKTIFLNSELTKTQVPVHSEMMVCDLHCFIIFKNEKNQNIKDKIIEQTIIENTGSTQLKKWLASSILKETFKAP